MSRDLRASTLLGLEVIYRKGSERNKDCNQINDDELAALGGCGIIGFVSPGDGGGLCVGFGWVACLYLEERMLDTFVLFCSSVLFSALLLWVVD